MCVQALHVGDYQEVRRARVVSCLMQVLVTELWSSDLNFWAIFRASETFFFNNLFLFYIRRCSAYR